MERFGVATLCHISRSQEQRNMACDVLTDSPPTTTEQKNLVLRKSRVAKTLQSSISKQESHQLAEFAKEVGVHSLVLNMLLE